MMVKYYYEVLQLQYNRSAMLDITSGVIVFYYLLTAEALGCH